MAVSNPYNSILMTKDVTFFSNFLARQSTFPSYSSVAVLLANYGEYLRYSEFYQKKVIQFYRVILSTEISHVKDSRDICGPERTRFRS